MAIVLLRVCIDHGRRTTIGAGEFLWHSAFLQLTLRLQIALQQRRLEVIVPRARVVTLKASQRGRNAVAPAFRSRPPALRKTTALFLLFGECMTSQLGSGVSLVRPSAGCTSAGSCNTVARWPTYTRLSRTSWPFGNSGSESLSSVSDSLIRTTPTCRTRHLRRIPVRPPAAGIRRHSALPLPQIHG